MERSERIDKYLREQMTPEEQEAFLNDLRTDKGLRDEAQAMALLIKEMREQQAEQDAELIEEVLAENKAKASACMTGTDGPDFSFAAASDTKWFSSWGIAIAAMFVLFFGLGWGGSRMYMTYRMNTLFDNYYESYESIAQPSRSKGGEGDVEKELTELFNQVGTAKDINPVIERLQTIYDNIDNEYEYSLYEDDITWYLALAYIKDHNVEEAKKLLRTITNNKDYDVEQLLKEIENK